MNAGGHAEAADLVISTPYPSVVAQPGSTVKFDLAVTAPAVSVAELAVDQLPTGWATTLRGGGFVVKVTMSKPLLIRPRSNAWRTPASSSTINTRGRTFDTADSLYHHTTVRRAGTPPCAEQAKSKQLAGPESPAS